MGDIVAFKKIRESEIKAAFIDAEIDAMRACVTALWSIDPAGRERAIKWLMTLIAEVTTMGVHQQYDDFRCSKCKKLSKLGGIIGVFDADGEPQLCSPCRAAEHLDKRATEKAATKASKRHIRPIRYRTT